MDARIKINRENMNFSMKDIILNTEYSPYNYNLNKIINYSFLKIA